MKQDYLFSSDEYWHKQGKIVTETITFKGGYRKTINNIKVESIRQSDFTHMDTIDGKLILVNPTNVLMVEVTEVK